MDSLVIAVQVFLTFAAIVFITIFVLALRFTILPHFQWYRKWCGGSWSYYGGSWSKFEPRPKDENWTID